MTEPYHRGEIAVQEQAGERGKAVLNGRVMSKVIPPAARPFVSQQSSVAFGWLDAEGDPWASLLVGEPGFASADETGQAMTIQTSGIETLLGDTPLPARVGMLVIDLATRRRLRVNGVAERFLLDTLRVAVEQAFPNCPKYIQARERVLSPGGVSPSPIARGDGPPTNLAAWLSRVDTAFVASVGPDGHVDCSHRGGRQGFMHMDGDAVMIPDYPGNSMFCSLGNLAVDGRAGLALVDFDAGLQLHLSGDTNILMAKSDRIDLTGGTGRWWSLRPRRWIVSPLAGATRWHLTDESPFNPPVQS